MLSLTQVHFEFDYVVQTLIKCGLSWCLVQYPLNTVSNAIAGILLLSSSPFKIGDRIKTEQSDESVGDVIEISLCILK